MNWRVPLPKNDPLLTFWWKHGTMERPEPFVRGTVIVDVYAVSRCSASRDANSVTLSSGSGAEVTLTRGANGEITAFADHTRQVGMTTYPSSCIVATWTVNDERCAFPSVSGDVTF